MKEHQSLRQIVFRVAIWAASFSALIWTLAQISSPRDDKDSFIYYVGLGGGLFFGTLLGRAISDLLTRLGLRFSHSATGEIARLVFWLIVIYLSLWLHQFPHDQGGILGTISSYAMFIVLYGLLGFFLSLLHLGSSWRARQGDGRKAITMAMGLRATSILLGGGFLFLAGFLIDGALDGKGINPFTMVLVLAFLIGLGGWLVLAALFIRIDYDDTRICARMDRLLNRRHCHRWADLTGVEAAEGSLRLTFADGGRVIAASFGLTGYGELADFAHKVLARNRNGKDQP